MATNYEPATAGHRIEEAASRIASAIRRKAGAGLRHVQYCQMVSVLNRLPDIHLRQAGLRRSDIADYARRSIYGES